MSLLSSIRAHLTKRKAKRTDAATMRTLQETALLFETLNKFKSAGLLYYDFRHNIVTIAQALAEHFIYDDEDWQRFLRQCHLWAAYQYSINEYTKMYNKVQADAEAAAWAEKQKREPRGNSLGTVANPDGQQATVPEGSPEGQPAPLTPDERRAARMAAVAKLDAETASHRALPIPDLQFLVLGAADGKPICVARQIDGIFHTAVVPDEEEE